MWGTFSRLGSYLAAQGHAGTGRLTLTFGELEEILGRPLPLQARSDPDWWGNNPRSKQGRLGATYRWYGWLSVGWEAAADVPGGTVTFRHRRPAAPA